ncbi:hypothetical protein Trydic_g7935 [Trypoxylus dichotomus]
MKPHHLEIVQQLTNVEKQARVSAARIPLIMVDMEPNILFMFPGEEAFYISGRVKKHNCVCGGSSIAHAKFPEGERLVCCEQIRSDWILLF